MVFFFFFKQKTAYEIKECDWSSDVCSSDLPEGGTVLSIFVVGQILNHQKIAGKPDKILFGKIT